MTTVADDTFATFVGHLAEALDDPGTTDGLCATGDQWAERLHFSRFHFDRMIRSVACEPPAAFRRQRPGHLQLEAPSGVHFHPPAGLRLPSRDKVTSMDLLTKMVEHHVWLTGEMVRTAERLDDTLLDQPIVLDVDEDEQTIRSLLSRLIGQMGMWNAAMETRDYDWSVEHHEPVASMRDRLSVEAPAFLSRVREVVEEQRLDDTFVDALCDPPELFTYGGMVAHVLTFAAHRRTLVALALAHHGVDDLGWGDPMQWVAQQA